MNDLVYLIRSGLKEDHPVVRSLCETCNMSFEKAQEFSTGTPIDKITKEG